MTDKKPKLTEKMIDGFARTQWGFPLLSEQGNWLNHNNQLIAEYFYEQGKLDLAKTIISEMDKEEYWESVLLDDGEDRRLFDNYHFENWLKSQIAKNADEEANIEAYKQAENDEARRGSEEK